MGLPASATNWDPMIIQAISVIYPQAQALEDQAKRR